jgi:hypothetical protein
MHNFIISFGCHAEFHDIRDISVGGGKARGFDRPCPESSASQLRRILARYFCYYHKQGGALLGETLGQKWPVCKMSKDGKEFWIVLLITSGEYYTGTYTFRIIEKGEKAQKKK